MNPIVAPWWCAKGSSSTAPSCLPEQGVVAELRVGVEGQVIGGQGDAPVEQDLQASLQRLVHRPHPGAPEEAVVDEHQLGLRGGRPLEHLRVGRHPGDDRAHAVRARDLEAVDAVVLETTRLEDPVGLGDQLGDGGWHRATLAPGSGAGLVGPWGGVRTRGLRCRPYAARPVGRAPFGPDPVCDTGGSSGRGAAW